MAILITYRFKDNVEKLLLSTASQMWEFPPFLFHIYFNSACNNDFSIIFYLS